MSQAQSYTAFGRNEFEEFLSDFAFGEVEEGSGEAVYAINVPHDDLEIRVFSTLQGGKARACGNDAIRCVLWETEHDEPVGGMKKTLRIETWRSNLRPKIKDLLVNWRDHFNGYCPECGSGVLKSREGKYGAFLGCSNYPACDHTE